MKDEAIKFNEEANNIKLERSLYYIDNTGAKVLDYLSIGFLIVGFIALILVYFTNITLVQATCFFVISYTISPSDMDMNSNFLKTIAEDIVHIRINTKLGNNKEAE